MDESASMRSKADAPVCWCGQTDLPAFSPEYVLCTACGTLVTRGGLRAAEIEVRDDDRDFYGKDYWLGHQVRDLSNPDIFTRARADMPERCMHWLRALLQYKLPPARVLEIGCAHGGFVALLRWAGFDALGLELSPWVVQFARQTFDVPILLGPIENQALPEQSLDAIVLNDVVEHLPDPLATLSHCAKLLKNDGILVVQMPCYPEGATFEEMQARQDRFLEQMVGKAHQHLHLFSKRSARRLFDRLGFTALNFVPALFDFYDMYLITSRQPLVRQDPEALAQILAATPGGRLSLAWLDLLFQYDAYRKAKEIDIQKLTAACEERVAIIQQLDATCKARLAAIQELDSALSARYGGRLLFRGSRGILRRLKRLGSRLMHGTASTAKESKGGVL
jgi:SAM-dependent methyltransferase